MRRTTLEAYEYQDVPFDKIVEEVVSIRQRNRMPLCQVIFGLRNGPWVAPRLPGLNVEFVGSVAPRAHADVEVYCWERDEGLVVRWIQSRDLFDSWRVEQMARHYGHALEEVVDDGTQGL